MKKIGWFNNNRKLIDKKESKVSFLQIIGFIIMSVGILSLMISSFYNLSFIPSVVSVSFFVTMLGFAFAFPSLLIDPNKGLSTMRIAVFMVTNVICMLLLKIGWADGIKDLGAIGLDQYWVGIIAFVFGAKATQSFFENWGTKNESFNKTEQSISQNSSTINLSYSNDEIIQMAIKQFTLKHLDGIVGVGRNTEMVDGSLKSFLQINVKKPSLVEKYSKPLNVDLGNGNTQLITPKVVFVDKPVTHGQGVAGKGIINVGGMNGEGTLGCVVIDNITSKKHLLSCQHVLNHDFDYDNISSPIGIAFVSDTSKIIAKHVSGERTHEIDAALAEIISTENFDNSNFGKIRGTRNLTIADTDETVKVTIQGFDTDTNSTQKRTGVIINNGFYAEFEYDDGKNFGIEDLIVLSNKNGNTYTTISIPGYSGALVVDGNNYAIGLLVGGDSIYSYAIPINKILTAFDCSLL